LKTGKDWFLFIGPKALAVSSWKTCGKMKERKVPMQTIGLFDPENSFWRFLTKVFNVAYAGFLWFVVSLPLVTMGAATVALYTYTLQLVRGEEGYVGKTFFTAFKKHLRKASLLWLFMVLLASFLLFDLYLTRRMGGTLGNLLFFSLLSISFVVLITMIQIFPLLAQYDVSVRETMKRSFMLALGNLHYSVTLLVIFILQAILLYYVPVTVFASTGFSVVLSSFFLSYLYAKYPNLVKYE
jgi:uncharacterized membrane protein YesL